MLIWSLYADFSRAPPAVKWASLSGCCALACWVASSPGWVSHCPRRWPWSPLPMRTLGITEAGWLHGLKVVAVAVVAQAVWGMARTLAPDRERASLAFLAATAMLAFPTLVAKSSSLSWQVSSAGCGCRRPPPRVTQACVSPSGIGGQSWPGCSFSGCCWGCRSLSSGYRGEALAVFDSFSGSALWYSVEAMSFFLSCKRKSYLQVGSPMSSSWRVMGRLRPSLAPSSPLPPIWER